MWTRMTSLTESALDGKISYPQTWYGSVYEKVSQSNSRFNALDTLVVTVHSVKMPVGFGEHTFKSRGRPLSVMIQFKRRIVDVQAEENCLAHAPIKAIWRLEKDPNYNSYWRGRRIRHVVQNLFKMTGIYLSNRAGISEIVRFQVHFREYKTVVYRGLSCEDIVFEGNFDSFTMMSNDIITWWLTFLLPCLESRWIKGIKIMYNWRHSRPWSDV